MSEWLLDLPTWMIARVTGFAAYYLLFAGIFLGILYGMPSLRGNWKSRVYQWHSGTQWAGFLFVLAHAMILVIDHYSPFNWSQLLIPFSHPDKPIPYGLGSLALYLLLLVLVTSDFRALLPKKLWLGVHLLSYPAYFAFFIHGFYSGTDSQSLPALAGYVGTAAALLVLTFIRGAAESRKEAGRPAAANTTVERRKLVP